MKNLSLFLLFIFGHLIFQIFNMSIAKNAESLILFNKQYHSQTSYIVMGVLLFTPFLTIANIAFGFGFQLGFKHFGNIWTITIIFISSQMLAALISNLIILGHGLQKGPFAGFVISIIGLLIANLWK